MKDSLTQENSSDYVNLIISLANTAITQTEGVAQGAGKQKRGLRSRSSVREGTHVYIGGTTVTVDVYVDVIFGYSVPQVACELQEKIIRAIKENTPLTPGAINVNVTNAIFLSI